jgi:DNA-binding CsgD family transcriptional regulator
VCSLADACVLVGDTRRGLQLYELLLPHEGDNAVTYSKQTFGPVALRLGKLATLLARWADAERHFATALERCELLCARAIRARVLLDHAGALAARGETDDRERIAAMLDEAAALCDELGMRSLMDRASGLLTSEAERSSIARPAPAEGVAPPGHVQDLSAREREVMLLVSEGLSNEAIAERLHLSVRTVERHLSNVYVKLRVSGKAARAAAAVRFSRVG